MRRLPIFFVLDVSESMIGENLKKLEAGLSSIIGALRQDPHALETVYISVIAFAGKANTIVPLIDVASFYPPKLPIGGGTSLGAALFQLMAEIDKSVVKTTTDTKGDWRPIVYLLTDGKPTDNVNSAISKWLNEYAKKVTLVAVAIGKFADLAVLKRLTDHVFQLDNSNPDDFKKFIQWVTASVTTQSKSLTDTPDDGAHLAKFDATVLSLIKDVQAMPPADPDYVIITGRCQRTKLPYLMKYERDSRELKLEHFAMQATQYGIAGCYPVDESYFEWSDGLGGVLKIHTSELLGSPGCPHCGNISAFAMCGCGGIMCINGPGKFVCPWCNKDVVFSAGSGDDEGFDVNRARG